MTVTLALGLCTWAQTTPRWMGLGQEAQGAPVTLWSLGSSGEQEATVVTVHVGSGEEVVEDSLRCVPYGQLCYFATTDATGSTVYGYNATTGAMTSKVELKGMDVHNLHLPMVNKEWVTMGLAFKGPTSATYIYIFANGTTAPVADLSPYLKAGDSVPAGLTTSCGQDTIPNGGIWTGIKGADASDDRIVEMDLTGKLVQTIPQPSGLPASLWEEKGVLAGMVTAAGQIEYALIASDGSYKAQNSGTPPAHSPAYVLQSLICIPSPRFGHFVTLYPEGTTKYTNTTGVGGYFPSSSGPITFIALSYHLLGASPLH